MALGSALVYGAELGTGSIGTVVDGVHRVLGISRGMAYITVSLVLLIVAAASVVWSLLGGKLKRHGEKEA